MSMCTSEVQGEDIGYKEDKEGKYIGADQPTAD